MYNGRGFCSNFQFEIYVCVDEFKFKFIYKVCLGILNIKERGNIGKILKLWEGFVKQLIWGSYNLENINVIFFKFFNLYC